MGPTRRTGSWTVVLCCPGSVFRGLEIAYAPLENYSPDLPVEEGDESSMEGLVPCEAPAERRGSRTRKDKHIIVDDDAGDGGCFPDNILEDYLNSDEQFDLEELLGYGGPAADGGTRKGSEFSKALRMGELDDVLIPTRPFSELDDGFVLSGIRCPRP
ncbi:hypothetical protein HID58_048669 [Brassica napus]|uniref:Uncharacterized protein n=1 Tax=Brassica napus TaxID=3708 RepID=A0ABQ8B2S4_BRANA|nr:hypothetical protein HID58_048669 [Brassica napus]